MPESTQHKLDRIRPPRVQITYDVEIGGAIQKKELPLVVGVLSDLSGATANTISLKERKFIEIDRDNFNDVLKSIGPSISTSVTGYLDKDQAMLPIELKFESIDDFAPARIVDQIDALKKLLSSRQKLNDLLAKLDGNDMLDDALLDVVSKPDELKQLKASNSPEGETANA